VKLKELLIDWLTESRYCRFVESQLIQQRQDFTGRLAEKDEQIHSLRVELSAQKLESDRMRLILMPLGSPAGAAYAASFSSPQYRPPADKPAFEPADDWQSALNKIYREEEDGISEFGREKVHKQTANDGSQSQP
jgi:hypothetical protein